MIEKLQPKLTLLAALFLAYLACTLFFPVLGSEFLYYDVYDQVVENPDVRGLTLDNLKNIFTSRSITSYYPVRTLTYAVDHQIWGLNPTGFKLTNGLLHVTNVLLLFWLLRRLLRHPVAGNPMGENWWHTAVATFAAGIFAAHPVVVEPVAWVAGREELLMMLGMLGCFHSHLSARSAENNKAKPRRVFACYFASTFFCAVACLSNAVAAVIPVVLTAWDLLTLERPKAGRIIRGTLPIWLLGAVTLVTKLLGPETTVVGWSPMSPVERLGVVLNLYWLNLGTLFWPTKLAFCYPDVAPDGLGDSGVILGGLAICLTCLALWALRRRKLVFFGLIWFGIALAPSAQIIPHHIHRVDRFLYLPLVGLLIAVAAALGPLRNFLRNRARVTAAITAGILCLLTLNSLAIRQAGTWQSSVSIWENSLSVSPDDAEAHCALADSLVSHAQFDRAAETYREAMSRHPDDARIHVNFSWLLATCPDEPPRDFELAVELAEKGCELDESDDPAFRHSLTVVYCSYAKELTRLGEFRQAESYCRKALAVDPDCQQALLQLAELSEPSTPHE